MSSSDIGYMLLKGTGEIPDFIASENWGRTNKLNVRPSWSLLKNETCDRYVLPRLGYTGQKTIQFFEKG